tara:strand:- start:49 stop:1455 length:1407 start_codon:yes stop_codon:yes gene_type:complete
MALTTINSSGIKDDSLVNADIKSDAAIAGSKLVAATTSVSGSMSAADKTKLDGVATSATANPSAPALTGSTNNTICTVTGANAIQGEANLTFDGTNLSLTGEFDLSGDIRISDTIKHTGDVDTKIRFPAADTFSVEAGAVEKLRIEGDYAGTVDVKGIPAHLRLYSQRDTDDWDATDPIGKLDYYVGSDTSNNLPYNAGFIHCLNETDNANEPSGALVFGTSTANASGGAVERLRIDSSGKVGVNEDSPDTSLHVKVTSTEGIRLERNGGAISELVNDTDLSTLGTTNNFNLAFKTNNIERARVLTDGGFKINDGDLVIGTAGHGIDFSATSHASGMASETLDSYEEGTFTPAILFDVGGSNIGYSSRSGTYTIVGRVCTINYLITGITGVGDGAANYFARLALPFTGISGTGQETKVRQWNSGDEEWWVSVGGTNPVFFDGHANASYARGNDVNGRTLSGTYTYFIS